MSKKCNDPYCTANRKDDKRGSHVSEKRKKPSRKKTRIVNNSHNPSRHRKMKENYNKEFNCGPVSKGFSPCPFGSTSAQNYRKGSSTGTLRVRCSKKSGNQRQHWNHSSNASKYLTQEKEKDLSIWEARNKNIHCSCVDRLRMERNCICGLIGTKLENKMPCKCGRTIKKLKGNYVLCPSFSSHAHCQCHRHCDKYSDKVRKDHSYESNKSTTSTFHKLCSCFRRKSNSTLSQLSSKQCLCRDSTEESFVSYESSESFNTQDSHETDKKHVLYPIKNIHKIEGCECLQEKDMPEQYRESCCKCIRRKTKTCIKPSSESTKVTKCKKTKRNKKNGYSSSECTQSIREKGGGSKSFTPNGSFACVLKEREENSPLQSSQSNNTNESDSSLALKDNQASCLECQQRIHKPEKLRSQIIASTEETVRRDETKKKKKRKNKGSRLQGSKSTVMSIMFDIIFWPYAFWPGRRPRSQFCRRASK